MVRAKSQTRLTEILDAAADAFLELGYRGARLDGIARRAAVSIGTLYLYAASKEALFELVLRRALGEPLPRLSALPFPGEGGERLVEWVWTRFEEIARFPVLAAAAETARPADPMAEMKAVLDELWAWHARYWQAIELIERCAREWPELHMLFYKQFRRGAFAKATALVQRRMDEGAVRRFPDAATAVRVVSESIAFFAMHRHVRPDSAELDEQTCRDTVTTMVLAGFDPRCTDGSPGETS